MLRNNSVFESINSINPNIRPVLDLKKFVNADLVSSALAERNDAQMMNLKVYKYLELYEFRIM